MIRLWLTGVEATVHTIYWFLAVLSGFMCLSGSSLAQVGQEPNVCVNPGGAAQGGFSLDKASVCVGTPIQIVSVPATVANVAYTYEYDGNGIPANRTAATTYTYSKPGSYTILQVGSGGGQAIGTIACRIVTVLPTGPVSFSVRTCSDRRAVVDVTLDENSNKYDSYIIDWGDGNRQERPRGSITTQQTHTYLNPGTYTVIITGRYAALTDCRPVPARSAPINFATTAQPLITRLTTVSDNSISIQYQVSSGTTVELYQKDASGVYAPTGQNGNGSTPFTVQTNAKEVQCFQLVAQDACNSAGVRSDEVCSLVLNAQAASKQNNLSWQPYAGTVTTLRPFRSYRLTRNGAPIGGLLTSRSASSYVDNNRIECGVAYCYTIEASAGPTTITSAPVCVTGINGDVPGEFRNVTVSVENNQPRLVVSLPVSGTSASYTLVVNRTDGKSGAMQTVGSVVNRNTFVDESANASAGSYCYEVTYRNNCGLTSPPSKPVCTVHLASNSSTSIDWTAESPFLTGPVANYTVEVIDSLNGTKREIPVSGNTRYEPDQNDPNLQSQRYRIIAVSSGGLVSYSNFFTLRREARILVPDAFTPNGDGINDTFVVKGVFVDQFRMTIYDRWGSVIYSTADKNQGWDGTVNGQPAAAGQYMYQIEVQDLTGQKTVRPGALLLIR